MIPTPSLFAEPSRPIAMGMATANSFQNIVYERAFHML